MNDKLEKIFNHYGYNNQRKKLIEECSELIRAIIRDDDENFVEELADVVILTEQILNHFEKYKEKFIKIKEAKDILKHVKATTEIIAIDEMQFFDEGIFEVIKTLIKDKRIIGCGLDLDFKGEPFGCMPQLMCYATTVDKLTAICMKCHKDNATHSQRIVNGEPASKDSPLIIIGADETYEARCINCWECE